jgi:hypothetical protein
MVEGRNTRKRRKVEAPLSKTYSLKPKTADSVAGFRVVGKYLRPAPFLWRGEREIIIPPNGGQYGQADRFNFGSSLRLFNGE